VGGRSNERRGSLSSLTQTSFGSTGAIEEQTSYLNEAEAEHVVSLLKGILDAQDPAVKSIGIISPYTAQVQLLQSVISHDGRLQNNLTSQGIELEIKSVDGYQGRERDIIIFSAVRSNRQGKIGFLSDWRRMNVALTRAKSALLIIGDFETLSDTDKYWASFRKWAEGAGCLVEQSMANVDRTSE
jgi:regulator of nonsense transcripts 1